MRVELANCEATILAEIENPTFTRDDVALTYAFCLRSSEMHRIDWKKINEAVVARWSLAALQYVKERAWKLVGGKA